MRTAIIGYTGFVGGNIDAQYAFDDKYNSKNIADITGKEYDLVVSAANRAEMWRINQEPEKDLDEIKQFIENLKQVNINKLVLISTVGVYKNPDMADEDTPIDLDGLSGYGKNRYFLEEFCRNNFDTTVIRLPGLFGVGLKKNVIYDLIHNNMVDKIHADGIYQYYNLGNIWKDIQIAINESLETVNFATEPISTRELAKYVFGMEFDNIPDGVQPAYWNMQSKYAKQYGGEGAYIYGKQIVLRDIKRFVESVKIQA